MKDGFIRVAAAVPDVRPGDCGFNSERIIETVHLAHAKGVRMLVLPELCVTGATCGDLFLHGTLLNAARSALEHIADRTKDLDIVFTVGLPLRIGGKVCNCAAVCSRGEVIGVVTKEKLSGRERRLFSSERRDIRFICTDYPDLTFEVVIGSDEPRTDAPFVLCMTAEPETVGADEYSRASAAVTSRDLHCIIVSANAGEGESTASSVYSGRRMIYENGTALTCGGLFESGISFADADIGFIAYERRSCCFECSGPAETIEFPLVPADTALTRVFPRFPFVPEDPRVLAERCERIFAMQYQSLGKRVEHSGAKKLVIGVSGGLDSTLALLVCAETACRRLGGKEDVIAVTMPCFGTTARTKSNAEKLSELLGVTLRTVDISEAVKLHFRDIGHDPEQHNAAFENAQARERTQVLMDIANDVNGLVVGTGDLSELALGWATYGGDQMSMYGVNAGIPKTLIQRIVGHFADESELGAVLRDIVDTPISPELLPGQKTEDSVGPYELHDFFLYQMIRRGSSPRKIYRLARDTFAGVYDSETIRKWLVTFCRRFFSQQFKRSCSPDGISVGSVSVSPSELKLPSDICGKLWINEAEALE